MTDTSHDTPLILGKVVPASGIPDPIGHTAAQLIARPQADPVVEAVRDLLLKRSQLGIKKYGKPLSRGDLSHRDWLQHALEECLDQANYLMAAIMNLDEKGHP